MASGKRWTREQLLIAMNLYCRLPFGQLHKTNPQIVAVSTKLGRTPSSLAMKLCNLASLDPTLQARGIKGLPGASDNDRLIWNEFHQDWSTLGEESEKLFEDLNIEKKIKGEPKLSPPVVTDAVALVKQRRGQQFFRATVLASFNFRCCVTGNPIRELLRASHIVSWNENPEHRLNPCNGLCLSATQDAAYDRHLFTLDEDLRIVLGKRIKEHFDFQTIQENFKQFEGKKIICPDKFSPSEDFLKIHRSKFSKSA